MLKEREKKDFLPGGETLFLVSAFSLLSLSLPLPL